MSTKNLQLDAGSLFLQRKGHLKHEQKNYKIMFAINRAYNKKYFKEIDVY